MNNRIDAIVRDNTRFFRKRKEWTQEQLAEKAGLSKIFIAEIESGKKTPSLSTLEKLAVALSIDPYYLLVPDPETFLSVSYQQNQILDFVSEAVQKLKK